MEPLFVSWPCSFADAYACLFFEFCPLAYQYYPLIEVGIRQCRSSGIDCKVHGLMVVGRLQTENDETAATFTFLASDNEEQPQRDQLHTETKKLKPMGTKDIQTHVFVWGLNDKDQLGGPKGSKVSTSICTCTKWHGTMWMLYIGMQVFSN